jgi:cation:H+ antiporter
MGGLVWIWAQFIACAALIAVAGPLLVRYGDIIAHQTGLSRNWIGLILLATATSLPELFTGMSAVTVAAAPNIAVGDVLGSCVFNLAMLVVLDELCRGEPLYRRIDQGHILTAGFGIVLLGSAGAALILSQAHLDISIWHISVYTPFIIILYLVAMRASFVYERRRPPLVEILKPKEVTLNTAILRYSAAAAAIVAAGSWLPFIGRDLSTSMGWNTSFVGTLLVAGITSLPELVVSVTAVRIDAVDLAISNLLGSNLFDILILGLDDVAYTKGSLFSAVSPAHTISVFAALVMSGIFVVAVLYRPQTRLRGVIGWVSIGLLLAYLFSSYAVYLHGR